MDILKLIKNRRTIRRYKNKPISKRIINRIIEAGRWGPSPHNSQPWEFVILEKQSKEKLVRELFAFSPNIYTSFKILLKSTLKIIESAPTIILVYNNCSLSKKVKKFKEPYYGITYLSEIEGISAAIQNMHLVASYLGLGMAWLTMPLFIKKRIDRIISKKGDLIAILAIGFPAGKTGIISRKKSSEVFNYITL